MVLDLISRLTGTGILYDPSRHRLSFVFANHGRLYVPHHAELEKGSINSS